LFCTNIVFNRKKEWVRLLSLKTSKNGKMTTFSPEKGQYRGEAIT